MTAQAREDDFSRAVRIARELLEDRTATKVQIDVTPGGRFRIVAEAEGGVKVAGHQWRSKR